MLFSHGHKNTLGKSKEAFTDFLGRFKREEGLLNALLQKTKQRASVRSNRLVGGYDSYLLLDFTFAGP